jgi:hypothetical protein
MENQLVQDKVTVSLTDNTLIISHDDKEIERHELVNGIYYIGVRVYEFSVGYHAGNMEQRYRYILSKEKASTMDYIVLGVECSARKKINKWFFPVGGQ